MCVDHVVVCRQLVWFDGFAGAGHVGQFLGCHRFNRSGSPYWFGAILRRKFLFLFGAQRLVSLPIGRFFAGREFFGFSKIESCLRTLLGAQGYPLRHAAVQLALVCRSHGIVILGQRNPFAFLSFADTGPIGSQRFERGLLQWRQVLPEGFGDDVNGSGCFTGSATGG